MDRKYWLAWRQKGIGSSDAAAIMGVSPWMTKLDLYENKIAEIVEEDDSNQFIKDMGNDLEPKVRSLYSLMTFEDFNVALLEMEAYPFIRASLDGRNGDMSKIIEIKLLGKDDLGAAKLGKVPEKYIPQIQHQLMVSKAESCAFLGYSHAEYKTSKEVKPEHLVEIVVLPDPSYQTILLTEEIKFWQENVQKKRPPIPSDKDYKTLRGIKNLVSTWKSLKVTFDRVEEEMEEIRSLIIAAAEEGGHPRYLSNGIRIRQETRMGNVVYKNIPELKGVDLDKYRNKGSTSWRIEIVDEN